MLLDSLSSGSRSDLIVGRRRQLNWLRSLPRDPLVRDTLTRDTLTRDTLTRDTLIRDTLIRDTLIRDTSNLICRLPDAGLQRLHARSSAVVQL